jgi:hypothetical protein
MSKRQDGISLPERLAATARSLTLTRQEHAMAAAILLSMMVGALVMHYRREYRIDHPVQASPTPRRGIESSSER